MARPKYKITDEDRFYAHRWIDNKIREGYGFPTEDWKERMEAEKEFGSLPREGEPINAWAEKWMKSGDWKQLKNAIRAQRKRKKDRLKDGGTVSIDLKRHAWIYLSDLAKHEGVTLSAFLENRFQKEWLALPMEEDED